MPLMYGELYLVLYMLAIAAAVLISIFGLVFLEIKLLMMLVDFIAWLIRRHNEKKTAGAEEATALSQPLSRPAGTPVRRPVIAPPPVHNADTDAVDELFSDPGFVEELRSGNSSSPGDEEVVEEGYLEQNSFDAAQQEVDLTPAETPEEGKPVFRELFVDLRVTTGPDKLAYYGGLLRQYRNCGEPIVPITLFTCLGCCLAADDDFKGALAQFQEARKLFLDADLDTQMTRAQAALTTIRKLAELGDAEAIRHLPEVEVLLSQGNQPVFRVRVFEILKANIESARASI